MLTRTRTSLLYGASALGVTAISMLSTSQANACQAIATTRAGIPVVDIVCAPGDAPVAPFQTSHAASAGNGADFFTMTGGSIVAGAPAPPPVNSGGTLDPSVPPDYIDFLDGDDVLVISGGTIGSAANRINIFLGGGADRVTMSGGTIYGYIFGQGGANVFDISGGTINGTLLAGSQNNLVSISGTAFIGQSPGEVDSVGLEDGSDRFVMTGGRLTGAVSGGDGDDIIIINGGSIGGFVAGNVGEDRIFILDGTIQQGVEGDSVYIAGGTINGDITGITGNTLIIDDSAAPAPINLQNGATISGAGVGGTAIIQNTDLAAGGAKTLFFTNFTSVTTSNATLGLGSGVQGIGVLTANAGSTIFAFGAVNMAASAVNLNSSTLTLANGFAGDTFTVGGIAFNAGVLGLDVNQRTLQADRINAAAFTGNGIINISLLGTPVFTQQTDIPIVFAPVAGTFVAQGLPGSQASLFTYELLPGPGGGLIVRATPANFGFALAPQNALDVSTIETVLDALFGLNDDVIETILGLANGANRVQLADNFGVFASGQFAHTEHDGFEITSGPLTADGPSFGANDFSAAISIDFDAAKHWGFDKEYGLNLGLFAGYASTDVKLHEFFGFDNVGDAFNQSAMLGGYGLFRREYTYALVSGVAFLGESDIFNGILNSNGDYGTEGYAITGSVGRIFMLSDTLRFDARGGLLGVIFQGDDYVDSNGNNFGGSEISFGALKLEPGIYMDRQLENGMTFSPYARADLQMRFGYENTASIDTREVKFDDSDFSAALSTGFNLKMTKSATMSGEVRGKLSADAWTVGGKLGLKVAF